MGTNVTAHPGVRTHRRIQLFVLQAGKQLLAVCVLPALLILLPATGSAGDPPAAPVPHLVTGLPSGQVLNVRAGPSAGAEDLGDLKEGAGPIDVLGRDGSGQWARIHWSERDAWVAARYLAPTSRPTIRGTGIPTGIRCHGSEPFWGISVFDPARLKLEMPGLLAEMRLPLETAMTSANHPSFPAALIATAEGFSASLIVRPGQCSDGMSDLTYGWIGDLLIHRDGGPILVSGCCANPGP